MQEWLDRTALAAALLLLPVAAAAQADYDPFQDGARYALEYRIDAAALGPGALRLWLPLPSDGPGQQVEEVAIEAPGAASQHRDALGNRMLYVELADAASAAPVVVRLRVARTPITGAPSGAGALDPSRFLTPQRRIPLDGVIAEIGRTVGRSDAAPDERIRADYDYVVDQMRYAKDGEGWGHGDAIWACTARYGNCTDFHSLFLGLARSQGIPARFEIGFPLSAAEPEGQVAGYHCWAWGFDPAAGWLPLDASEARKSGRRDAYFGRLPSDRVAFSVGRDLTLVPPQQGEPVNFFVYPYAERDGVALATPPWQLHYRRLEASPPATAAGAAR